MITGETTIVLTSLRYPYSKIRLVLKMDGTKNHTIYHWLWAEMTNAVQLSKDVKELSNYLYLFYKF